MQRLLKTLLFVATVTLLAAFAASCGSSGQGTTTTETAGAATDVVLPKQTSQSGKVNVAVMPGNIAADARIWTFKVTIDSQGPDLSEDLAAAAVIVDDSGKEYPSSGFEGDGPGSKHREGTLSFAAISPAPKAITMKIRGVGGIGERSFSWAVASE